MKFFIATYGCQMNKYDSNVIRDYMSMTNHSEAYTISDADIIFVNGCSVREHAEKRAIGFVNSMKSQIRKNARIYITGCLATALKEFPKHINGLIGTTHYDKIVDIINIDGFVDMRGTEGEGDYTNARIKNNVNLFISIMKGCNNFCSYCIVPYLRGKERSFSPEGIFKQIESSINTNTGEILLLGQNVNSYNYRGKRFPELLGEIADIFKNYRIRFITSHPKNFGESLIKVISDNKNIMNSVHLPFQSGSDKILKMMNRGYLQKDYLNKIYMLKQIIPDISITTDVMTGFPFETEHDFNDTMNVISEVRFDDAFMYKFSKRNYSLAGFMNDADENIKLRRLKHLIKIQNSIKIEKMATLKGKTVKVLIERKSKKSKNDCIGRDEGDRMIIIKGLFDTGTVIKADVIEIKGNTPVAIKKEE